MRISDWSSDVCSSDLEQPLSLRASSRKADWLTPPLHVRCRRQPAGRPPPARPTLLLHRPPRQCPDRPKSLCSACWLSLRLVSRRLPHGRPTHFGGLALLPPRFFPRPSLLLPLQLSPGV